jgi:hypothetical protein
MLSSVLTIKRNLVPLVALMIALVLAMLALSSAGGAATTVRTWTVEGTVNVGTVSVSFPSGSTFTATYDSSSGALTNGSLSVPTYNTTYAGYPLAVTLSDGGNVTGTLAANGAATINESVSASVNFSLIGVPCDVGPMAISLNTNSAHGGVDFHGNPSTGTLTDDGYGFTAPAALASGACTQSDADLLTAALPLPSRGDMTVTLTQISDVTPTTTSTTVATTPLATTPVTAAQRAQLAATGSPSGALLAGSVFLLAVGCAFVWRSKVHTRPE